MEQDLSKEGWAERYQSLSEEERDRLNKAIRSIRKNKKNKRGDILILLNLYVRLTSVTLDVAASDLNMITKDLGRGDLSVHFNTITAPPNDKDALNGCLVIIAIIALIVWLLS
jgi:hypothetical protein|nr:MAG TPA: hypothetical protein [Caudoviricetes sp.]